MNADGRFSFAVVDIKSSSALSSKLKQPEEDVSKYLAGKFSEDAKQTLADSQTDHVAKTLVEELNDIVKGSPIYDKQRFAKVSLSGHTKIIRTKKTLDADALAQFNQLLIKDAYPVEIWRILLSEIEALRNNDNHYWAETYQVLFAVAQRATRSLTFSEAERKGIATGAVLKIQQLLFQNRRQVNSGKHLICLTARRSHYDALNLAGKKDPLKKSESLDASLDDEDQPGKSLPDESVIPPDDQMCRLDDILLLRKAMTKLQDSQKNLLVAFHCEGKDYNELGEAYNLTIDQVGVYLKRARDKLKQLFDQENEDSL